MDTTTSHASIPLTMDSSKRTGGTSTALKACVKEQSDVRQPTSLFHQREQEDTWMKHHFDNECGQPVYTCYMAQRFKLHHVMADKYGSRTIRIRDTRDGDTSGGRVAGKTVTQQRVPAASLWDAVYKHYLSDGLVCLMDLTNVMHRCRAVKSREHERQQAQSLREVVPLLLHHRWQYELPLVQRTVENMMDTIAAGDRQLRRALTQVADHDVMLCISRYCQILEHRDPHYNQHLSSIVNARNWHVHWEFLRDALPNVFTIQIILHSLVKNPRASVAETRLVLRKSFPHCLRPSRLGAFHRVLAVCSKPGTMDSMTMFSMESTMVYHQLQQHMEAALCRLEHTLEVLYTGDHARRTNTHANSSERMPDLLKHGCVLFKLAVFEWSRCMMRCLTVAKSSEQVDGLDGFWEVLLQSEGQLTAFHHQAMACNPAQPDSLTDNTASTINNLVKQLNVNHSYMETWLARLRKSQRQSSDEGNLTGTEQ